MAPNSASLSLLVAAAALCPAAAFHTAVVARRPLAVSTALSRVDGAIEMRIRKRDKLLNLIKGIFGKEQWPRIGGMGGPHRMAGPWDPPPPREWPETVFSWYDRGTRLAHQWPSLGGTGGPHRMAGPWDPPEPRPWPESVFSWYDSGVRLREEVEPAAEAEVAKPAVVSWYDSGIRLREEEVEAAAQTTWTTTVMSWFDKKEPAAPSAAAEAVTGKVTPTAAAPKKKSGVVGKVTPTRIRIGGKKAEAPPPAGFKWAGTY